MNRRELLRTIAAGMGGPPLVGARQVDAGADRVYWKQVVDGNGVTAPTVVGGSVYVGDDEGNLYALDATSGTVQWRSSGENRGPIEWAPKVTDGTVYAVSRESPPGIHAVDAETGEAVWSYAEPNARVYDAPPVVADGTVYASRGSDHRNDDHALLAHDAETGERRWIADRFEGRVSQPLVADGSLFVGMSRLNTSHDTIGVRALDSSTGELRWRYDDVFSQLYVSPTLHEGRLYVASDHRIYAVDPTSGKRRLRSRPRGNGAFDASDLDPITVHDGTIYSQGSHELFAFDADTGDVRWFAKTDGLEATAPTVADGTVFTATRAGIDYDGKVYAVDASSGEIRWTFDTEHGTFHSPTVADGTLYVSTPGRVVYALDAGVDGSSADSRIRQETGRHVGEVTGGSNAPCARIDATTIAYDPYPVTTGDPVDVSVLARDAEEVTARASYVADSGEEVTVERTMEEVTGAAPNSVGTRWVTNEALPAVESVGARVDVEIEAANADGCGAAVRSAENEYAQERADLGFYVFDRLKRGIVVPGTFPGEELPFDPGSEAFAAWAKARVRDVNRYYGSGRGTMGAVGFDLTFAGTGEDGRGGPNIYELPMERSEYDGGVDRPAKGHFLADLRQAADGDVDWSTYDFWFGIHSGGPLNDEREGSYAVHPNPRVYSCRFGEPSKSHVIWAHEFGHVYGVTDLYGMMDPSGLALMGKTFREGPSIPTVPPVCTPTRLIDSLGLQTNALRNRDGRVEDWLTVGATDFDEFEAFERDVAALQSLEHGAAAPVVEKTRPGRPDVTFVPETRPYLGTSGIRLWGRDHGSAIVYRRAQSGLNLGGLGVVGGIPGGIMAEPGETVTDKIGVVNPSEITFELEAMGDKEASYEEFSTTVSARRGSGEANTETTAVVGEIRLPDDFDLPAHAPDSSFTPPSLELTATDTAGRRVGVAENGTYVNEIPGARASGNRVRGLEWISVPADADVEFSVSAADVERFVEDLRDAGYVAPADGGEGDDRMTVDELRENMTVEYESSRTRYGENPELVTSAGETWVDGATVSVDRNAVEPGADADPTPADDGGALAVVAIDHEGPVAEESITVENRGADLDLGGWSLESGSGATYSFPAGSEIARGERLVVYSGSGDDTDAELHWSADGTVWPDDGGRARLADADGELRLEVWFDERGVIYYDEPGSGSDESERAAAADSSTPAQNAALGAGALGALYIAARALSGDEDEEK